MRLLFAAPAALALAACSTIGGGPTAPPPAPAAVIAQALAAPDRADTDVERDASRHSAEVIAFTGVAPGDRVLDLGSLTGYMAWLFSGVVGPAGAVTAQNPPDWYDTYATVPPAMQALVAARRNATSEVMAFDRLSGAAGSYDLVFAGLIYHDTAALGVDRAAMNRRIYELLRPGGVYVIVDHAAEPGSGLRDAGTLHRIDRDVVRSEVESAGFRFSGALDVLENPDDDLSLSIFDPAVRGATSQFGLRFVKPANG